MKGAGDDRYAMQARVEQIGAAGQERLAHARAVVVGIGALGGNIAAQLVRSGVGSVTLIDSDVVEIGNLHRQVLYDEDDVKAARPKVVAASRRLAAANGQVRLTAVAERLTGENARELLRGATVVLDGTDNMETRYVINDACVEGAIPWVYGGVVATHGMVMPIVPGVGPCLRCLFDAPPPAGTVPTTQTVGVLGATPAVIGGLQAATAIRLIVSGFAPPARLASVDVWTLEFDSIEVDRLSGCPACGAGRFDFLGPSPSGAASNGRSST